jgi:hypothetical protein
MLTCITLPSQLALKKMLWDDNLSKIQFCSLVNPNYWNNNISDESPMDAKTCDTLLSSGPFSYN